MKRLYVLGFITTLCLSLAGCAAQTGTWIFGGLALLTGFVAIIRTFGSIQHRRNCKQNRRRKPETLSQILFTVILYVLTLVLVLAALVYNKPTISSADPSITPEATTQSPQKNDPQEETDPVEETIPSIITPVTNTASSDPANFNITWEIFVGDQKVDSYQRENPISFGEPEDYLELPGIATFRGNNYRNSPTYGTANIESATLKKAWSVETGLLAGGRWGGCGWTGQPLMAKWDKDVRATMNMYPSKQVKEDLVEVIYATLDGKIYFLDLDDGSATRDPIDMGMCFKGAGSLDPRGYPLLYVGSGDVNTDKERPRMFIISLIDGSVLYEYGHEDSLALRADNEGWCAFDSAPLIHKETDTLIWPGENGILYTMTLNTQYNKEAGTISIAPDNMVRTRYSHPKNSEDAYWYGYEAGANIIGNYLYTSENGGLFFCIDLNTMELVWAQDTKDDSNSTPVFEYISEDEAYIYTAPSLHWTKNEENQGSISIYKLNALTGEIVWEKPYNVHTVSGVSGGIQSSPVLGKEGTNMEGYIFYTISRTPEEASGILVALDTKTGEEAWRLDMRNYAWSSPAPVYTEDGNGYLVVCDSAGYMFLIDGKTGTQKNILTLGKMVEASPAIYENRIVVGLKKGPIHCIEIQ